MYELSHELPNDLENKKNIKIILKLHGGHSLMPSLP